MSNTKGSATLLETIRRSSEIARADEAEELEDLAYFAHEFAENLERYLESPDRENRKDLADVLKNFRDFTERGTRLVGGREALALRECLGFLRGKLWSVPGKAQALERRVVSVLGL